MSTPTLSDLRTALLTERASTLAQCGILDADSAALAATHASGDMRRELLAEGDTVSVERALFAQLSAGVRTTLASIENALTRMDAGTYGTCEGCGGEIPFERLEARPYSTTCVRCASRTRR